MSSFPIDGVIFLVNVLPYSYSHMQVICDAQSQTPKDFILNVTILQL